MAPNFWNSVFIWLKLRLFLKVYKFNYEVKTMKKYATEMQAVTNSLKDINGISPEEHDNIWPFQPSRLQNKSTPDELHPNCEAFPLFCPLSMRTKYN